MSTLTDSLGLYTEVTKVRVDVQKKKAELEILKAKLRENHQADDDELYNLGKEASVQEASVNMQYQIELACQAVKQRETAISKLAGIFPLFIFFIMSIFLSNSPIST